jgi:hypothetical protein
MSWRVNNRYVPQKLKRLKITQFPVNSNIATTGYILQGETKTRMIVTSWNCRNKT